MKLLNNTGGTSRIGSIIKVDPNNKNAFILVTASDTKCLGIVTEQVPYRSECEIATSGTIDVLVSGNVSRGQTVRSRKPSDGISAGMAVVAKGSDAPYLQIGTALESGGRGLVKVSLNLNYVMSNNDGGVIDWSLIGNPPTRIVTDSTTELHTDYLIVCNKASAMTVTLLAATGSNRILQVANVNTGKVTVTPSGTDTIQGETSQELYSGCIEMKDYATGKWLIK